MERLPLFHFAKVQIWAEKTEETASTKLKAKANMPFRFQIRIEMGDGKTLPPPEAAKEANKLLKGIKEGLQLQ